MVPSLLDPLTEAGDGGLLLIPGPGRDASSLILVTHIAAYLYILT